MIQRICRYYKIALLKLVTTSSQGLWLLYACIKLRPSWKKQQELREKPRRVSIILKEVGPVKFINPVRIWSSRMFIPTERVRTLNSESVYCAREVKAVLHELNWEKITSTVLQFLVIVLSSSKIGSSSFVQIRTLEVTDAGNVCRTFWTKLEQSRRVHVLKIKNVVAAVIVHVEIIVAVIELA